MKGMVRHAMALAEPTFRPYALRRLTRMRYRGGSLIGTAIGTGIGIGTSILTNYDITWPWNQMLQPKRSPRGVPSINGSAQNARYDQQYQTYRTTTSYNRRSKYNVKRKRSRRCCCSCC